MVIRVPAYFDSFKCIADKCAHSCCVGWDVYVDGETEKKYRRLDGEMGRRIRERLEACEDGVRIRLSEGRCPFLSDCGLCNIISELGEEYISEICAEHPRYYLTLGEYVFAGLGASCEEAARLILTEYGEHKYITREAVGFSPCDCDPDLFLAVHRSYLRSLDALREGDVLCAISKICSITEELDAKINGEFSEKTSHAPGDIAETARFFANAAENLEYMGNTVRERISACFSDIGSSEARLSHTYTEKLLLYFLDRYYMMIAEDGDALGHLGFILFSTVAISLSMRGELDENIEAFRSYSAEIEYNEDNVETIKNMTRQRYLLLAEMLKSTVK